MSFSTLRHLGLERSLVLLYTWVEYQDRLFEWWNLGASLTYDPMSDKISLSCTNSLVTIMVVINHRNIPWGPRCFQLTQLSLVKPMQWYQFNRSHWTYHLAVALHLLLLTTLHWRLASMDHQFNRCWKLCYCALDMLSDWVMAQYDCTDALFWHRRFNRCYCVR